MPISARNCFAARIIRIGQTAASADVELQLPGGERIVCVVTSNRALTLRLKPGGAAHALVSAASIILTTECENAFRFSARNQLTGSIRQLDAGPENTEVVVALRGGDALVALVSNASAKELGLTEGKAVCAMFKASSVILGVAV